MPAYFTEWENLFASIEAQVTFAPFTINNLDTSYVFSMIIV
ncbi:hypothetical protein BFV94_3388 [Alteromonas macleodii]|uniref:Uncharacterized protein n=1 Tax=Alteromonas macleodii TaxID=28108 RepID=A0AB36FQY6_ALTMA|nr:hypothetical protein BFV93_3378 [Alteromonas macleodii]OES28417.1 hypothetical protein BFV94_3388 [Alteromonas macleodii]OES28498.1 hypothetical protein BFV95_3390 [Alteromonas macleodii]OES39964.1 hypothetical protein BFV96_3373 [Alteromonas macleodii]